jgi:hypothetical protein
MIYSPYQYCAVDGARAVPSPARHCGAIPIGSRGRRGRAQVLRGEAQERGERATRGAEAGAGAAAPAVPVHALISPRKPAVLPQPEEKHLYVQLY